MSFWKKKAEALKTQTIALYFAWRDPRVPWYAKGWIALVVAYAFSPIDLIPDFIPVLGYLDDLVIVPLGVYLALRMIPAQVMQECQDKARQQLNEAHPKFRWMGVIVVVIWLVVFLLAVFWAARFLGVIRGTGNV